MKANVIKNNKEFVELLVVWFVKDLRDNSKNFTDEERQMYGAFLKNIIQRNIQDLNTQLQKIKQPQMSTEEVFELVFNKMLV